MLNNLALDRGEEYQQHAIAKEADDFLRSGEHYFFLRTALLEAKSLMLFYLSHLSTRCQIA